MSQSRKDNRKNESKKDLEAGKDMKWLSDGLKKSCKHPATGVLAKRKG